MEAAPPGGEQSAAASKKKSRGTRPHNAGHGKHRRLTKDASSLSAPKRDANNLLREQRLEKVATLRIEGMFIRDIAKKLGVSISTAHGDIQEALERTIDRTDKAIAIERQISLERIELATRAIMPRLKKGDDAAILSFTRLDQRRAKLLGLEAPVRAELTGPDGGAIAVAAPTSQLESKLDDLYKRLVGGGGSAPAAAAAPSASTGGERAGDEPSGSAGAQSG